MEQQKIRFAPGDRVQRTKSNGKKAHVGAQGTVSAILKSGNLQVRADGQPFAAPKPEVCAHARAQMLTEWPNAGEGYARDCFELRKAQQDTEIRAHYTRNMREWPTCQYGGKVEIKLWASTDTNAPGPMRYTYGLVCACCSKKVATK